jgi:hypothetical protein
MPKLDPSSVLPIEIWHTILRYSISVPGFFDPDDLVDRFPPWVIFRRGWSDSTSYYRAESTRNALQRVCRSWDAYLERYAHRFVRIPDVVHGNVPTQYLRTALRISLDDHSDKFCDACKPEQAWPGSSGPYHSSFLCSYFGLCSHLLQQQRPLKAEILDYGPRIYDNPKILDLWDILPNLVRIEANDAIKETEEIENIESLPVLCHIFRELEWLGTGNFSLKSSTLTTLILSIRIQRTSLLPLNKGTLCLPALRNLHIESCYYEDPDEYDEPAWVPLVEIIGKELRTLYLPLEANCSQSEVPRELWTLCPKLEDLYVPYVSFGTPPPIAHPLHTITMEGVWSKNLD